MSLTPTLLEELAPTIKSSTLLTPKSDGYAESLKRQCDNGVKQAGAVLLAESVQDISTAVVFCHKYSIDLAVKGGGHSSLGRSSSEGGLVIDLGRMRKVDVDVDNMTVTAEGGCLWADVDSAAGRHGLAAVGGTVNHTGIGGLTLGGGYGWLTGKHGLVVDNLLEVKMVLADGNFVTASKSQNPDLFWAARGAGHNFGVAVSFTYRAHEMKNPIYGGVLVFPSEKFDAVAEATNSIGWQLKGATAAWFGVASSPVDGQTCPMVVVFHDGPEEEALQIFDPILSLGPIMNMAQMMPYENANTVLNAHATPGGRVAPKSVYLQKSMPLSFYQMVRQEYSDFVARVPDAAHTFVVFEFGNRDLVTTVPVDAMAFPHRGPGINAMALCKWSDPALDSVCHDWARALMRKIAETQVAEGSAEKDIENAAGYGNYNEVDVNSQAVYGPNYTRLTELKARFDPGNLFNKGHPIVPALRN